MTFFDVGTTSLQHARELRSLSSVSDRHLSEVRNPAVPWTSESAESITPIAFRGNQPTPSPPIGPGGLAGGPPIPAFWNRKADPTPNDGVDDDTWLNATTGHLWHREDGQWVDQGKILLK